MALTSSKKGAQAARRERVPPTSYMSHSWPDSAPRRERERERAEDVSAWCVEEEEGAGASQGDGDGD